MSISWAVIKFFEFDQQIKSLGKQADPLKTEIKNYLRDNEEKTLSIEEAGLTAELQLQNRRSVNEDKLLQTLKKLNREDLIKTVEVPDMEQIETLIYNQELDATVLNDCLETKVVEVLKVARSKKKKETEDNG